MVLTAVGRGSEPKPPPKIIGIVIGAAGKMERALDVLNAERYSVYR